LEYKSNSIAIHDLQEVAFFLIFDSENQLFVHSFIRPLHRMGA